MCATDMAIIGLTGGIASGKSTVATVLRQRGAPVIDADLVAREVVQPDSELLEEIISTFGPQVRMEDGTLNRRVLGDIVFTSSDALKTLNGLMHPAIMKAVTGDVERLRAASVPWIVYEAALILENKLHPTLTELVVVVCEPENQIKRLMKRNQLTETAARQRLDAQTNNDTRRRHADRILRNDASLEALSQKAAQLFSELVKEYGALTNDANRH